MPEESYILNPGLLIQDDPVKKETQISVSQTRLLIQLVRNSGISAGTLKEATGIDSKGMEDPEFAVSAENTCRLWRYAVEVTGDPALALRLGKERSSAMPGFGKRIAQYSRDLREALEHWISYSWISSSVTRTEYRCEQGTARICHRILTPEHQSVLVSEHALSVLYHYSCYITDKELPLYRVRFTHPKPEYASEYTRVFPGEILFDQEENVLEIPEESLDTPVVFHDPMMVTILKHFADTRRTGKDPVPTICEKAAEYLVTCLPKGNISAESTAETLNMTRSTLHRKLRKEGTSFRELLETTRRELALSYLKQDFSASEITYLLGYATPSSFLHSFKKWFGMNTGEMKQTLER